MKRRINNQLDADKLRFIDVISSTCFGHHYAHHQEYNMFRASLCPSSGVQHVSGIIMPIIRSTPDAGHNDARYMLS
jgi:hypothetical protein